MPTPGFAVVDVRTTGLWPERHHRIVDIAVVHVDDSGAIERSWATLLDSGREVDPANAGYDGAPDFADIAATLVGLLAGRIIVAHNAAFELRFLAAEFERSGLLFPVEPGDALCTMRLARQILPGAGRSLADCCAAYDIELGLERSTLADADATARLLASFLVQSTLTTLIAGRDTRALLAEWPDLRDESPAPMVRSAVGCAPRSFLERTMSLLPDFEWQEQVDLRQREYLGMLDQALACGFLLVHEARELREYAATLDIDPFARDILHRRYFDNLVTAAWAAAALTDAERADLVSVARLLELPTQMVVWAIKPRALHWPPPGIEIEDLVSAAPPVTLERGDAVVLSGALSRPVSFFEQVLTDLGMVPATAVTREVTLLVAADVDSDSGRCRKARDYGIPILSEEALMGVLVG